GWWRRRARRRRRGRSATSIGRWPRRTSTPSCRAESLMARRRFVVAMMMHETNTFSPVTTPLASFRPLSGQAAIEEFRDTNTQLGGVLPVAPEADAQVGLPGAGRGPPP